MAIHRAAYLADVRTDHSGPTLLLTFNRTLLAYLNWLRPPELTGVDVLNYHAFARGYLGSRGRMGYGWIATPGQRERFINEALISVRNGNKGSSLLARPVDFFTGEIRWMNQHGLTELSLYIAADRVGRARLARDHRPLMFDVYQRYVELRAAAGLRYDWDDVAVATRQAFEKDVDDRMYRHVVVDEGQDFSPEMIRSLALAIPKDGSLTLFGDVAQQIYGRRLSWRQAGLNVDAVWRFKKNYRNSPQIAALGLAIAEMPYFADEPDMVAPDEFAADGPPPTFVRFDDSTAETEFVVEQAVAAAQTGSVGVLVRRHNDEARFHRAFSRGQHLTPDMKIWRPEPGVSYGTIHAAKGFEFDTVILPGLGTARLPDPIAVQVEGTDEASAQDGRLLYVAVSRARQNLVMSCTGEPTSLLPENKGLWIEATPP